MKLPVFFHDKEGYKNAIEGHFPFLLGFDINYKIMVLKYLGPDH
jgi:hypothetical protein